MNSQSPATATDDHRVENVFFASALFVRFVVKFHCPRVAQGLLIRVPSPSQVFQAIGSMLGGNRRARIEMYSELCATARREAYGQLIAQARNLGADAVIAMRYDTNNLTDGLSEILDDGTAVKLRARTA